MTSNIDLDQLKVVCLLEIKEFSGAFIRTNYGFHSEDVSNREVLNWLRKGNDLSKVERVMNHLHVCDIFMNATDSEYDDIAISILLEWNRILKSIDPDFRVIKFDDLGPTVSFFKVRQ